jgi:hypothetical protein
MNTKLEIEFSPPRHGWMQVRLGNELQFTASHVPFDSLAELVNALSAFLESGRAGVARFNCEPEAYELSIEPGIAPGLLRLRAGSAREHWSHEGDAQKIGRTIWRALRKLESQFDPTHWTHGFPSRALETLGRLTS